MTPATRARLCAALERETGRSWAPCQNDSATVSTIDPPSCWQVTTRLHAVYAWGGMIEIVRPDRRRVPVGPFTGRGWPERLAVEVGRVLSETATTGGADV